MDKLIASQSGSKEITRRDAIRLSAGALAALSVSGANLASAADSAGDPSIQITQVRNATLKIVYAGVRFLVDPMLGPVGSFAGAPGSAHSELRNPLVPLTLTVDEIVDVDAVIVTHLHTDHWDDEAKRKIPKNLPLFAQNEEDAAKSRADGFSDVRVLSTETQFKGIRLSRTKGQHGSDEAMKVIGDRMGQVCGVVFSKPGLKKLYVAGDTVWNQHVQAALDEHRPDIIVLNAGHALFLMLGPIIMGAEDVLKVHKAAPNAVLIASHMESLNHCVLSRSDLRAFSRKNGFDASLLIPADGEMITL